MPFAVPPPNMKSPSQFPYYGYPWQQITCNKVQPNPGNMVQQNPGNYEQPQLGNQVLPIPPQPQLINNQQPNSRGQQPVVNQPPGMETNQRHPLDLEEDRIVN